MAVYLDAARIECALKKAGKGEKFCLKVEQRAIIEAVVCFKKDVLGVLPTGFGKSLVFHLLYDVFDFVDGKGPPTKTKAITIVISPLNALMRDQIGKLDHLGAIILDGTKTTNHLAMSLATDGKLQLIFSHPELLLVNNTKTMLKTTNFQRNVRCIVVDEAHLVDDW
jgi:ATP-dependent DNA helicase RecQ